MWLCLQRHDPGSPWAPYLRALPNTFDLPFLWPVRRALRPGGASHSVMKLAEIILSPIDDCCAFRTVCSPGSRSIGCLSGLRAKHTIERTTLIRGGGAGLDGTPDARGVHAAAAVLHGLSGREAGVRL